MGRSCCNSANDARRPLVAIAVALALLTGCDGERERSAGDAPRGRVQSALPTPAGVSGGSVTGMPTSPPAGAAEPAVIEEPAAVAGEPGDATIPVDPNAIPVDPATGLAVGAPPAAADAPLADLGAASTVVRDYMAALSAGSLAGAQQLWSATPNDSAVLQLARESAFAVDVLPPTRPTDAAAAAAGVVNVPAQVRGTAEDGSPRSLLAIYTVRRTADGAWRITSASVRENAP